MYNKKGDFGFTFGNYFFVLVAVAIVFVMFLIVGNLRTVSLNTNILEVRTGFNKIYYDTSIVKRVYQDGHVYIDVDHLRSLNGNISFVYPNNKYMGGKVAIIMSNKTVDAYFNKKAYDGFIPLSGKKGTVTLLNKSFAINALDNGTYVPATLLIEVVHE